jgi:hypothetical protein
MSENVQEHMENLLNALVALSPSRNLIVQFMAMTPMDLPTMMDAYPELLRDEETRQALKTIFNVTFAEQVGRPESGYDSSSIGYELRECLFGSYGFYKDLERADVRSSIAQILGKDVEEIPNPKKEWMELKLNGISMEPTYGTDAVRVLKTVKRICENSDRYMATISTIANESGIEEERIHRVCSLLTKYQLVEKTEVPEELNGERIEKEGIKFSDYLVGYVSLIDELHV